MNKPPHKPKKYYKHPKPKVKEGENTTEVARPAQAAVNPNPPRERHAPRPQGQNQPQNKPQGQPNPPQNRAQGQNQPQRRVPQEPQEPRYPRISNEDAQNLFENIEAIRQVKTYNELAVGEVERLRMENLLLLEQIKEMEARIVRKSKKILTLSSEEEPEIYKQKVKQLTTSFENFLQTEKERESLDDDDLSATEEDHE